MSPVEGQVTQVREYHIFLISYDTLSLLHTGSLSLFYFRITSRIIITFLITESLAGSISLFLLPDHSPDRYHFFLLSDHLPDQYHFFLYRISSRISITFSFTGSFFLSPDHLPDLIQHFSLSRLSVFFCDYFFSKYFYEMSLTLVITLMSFLAFNF